MKLPVVLSTLALVSGDRRTTSTLAIYNDADNSGLSDFNSLPLLSL
jgi:hypothetical protein